MPKEKKPKEKPKKKRKGSGNLPTSEPIPGLPSNKNNQGEKQRSPVPPGEMPPLPIYAPAEPGNQVPVYF